MGSCSMSEELRYFCKKHGTRPLLEKQKKEGNSRCFQVTGCELENLNNIQFCNIGGGPDGCRRAHSTWLRWAVSPGSRSVFAVHQHLSSWGDDAAGMEEVTEGEKSKGSRSRPRARPVETFRVKAWPLDIKRLLPTVSCLPFSRHVQQQEGPFPFVSRNAAPCVPPWPEPLLITHLPPREAEGLIKKNGKAKDF